MSERKLRVYPVPTRRSWLLRLSDSSGHFSICLVKDQTLAGHVRDYVEDCIKFDPAAPVSVLQEMACFYRDLVLLRDSLPDAQFNNMLGTAIAKSVK